MIPTFDIEAVNWINPIAVGFFDGYQYREFIRESEEDDVIWRFLTFLKENFAGGKIYAHCASKYDSKFILSCLHKHGETAVPEAGLIRLRWKSPNICFEDSYLLLPMPLVELTKMFGVEEKEEWPHELNLKPWEMGNQLGTFRSYLRKDCVSLSESLDRFCNVLGENFNITPSISLSTTSAKAFDKVFYNVQDINPNEEFEEVIRQAIYGGRNEVYRRYGENIRMYDFHDMYTSCYDTPVPIGKMYWAKPNLEDSEGCMVEALVKVPLDSYIGPLPLKYKGKLVFPVGELPLTWWDIEEVRNAVHLGCDTIVRRQINGKRGPVLKSFGEFSTKLRRRLVDQEYFWKMFGVSLSGKFGQGRWRDTIKYVDDVKDFEGYSPLDEEELYYLTKEYMRGPAPYIRPAIAMRIRAEARTRHLRGILAALKMGAVYYCDTDSIFTTSKLETGKDPGDLEYLGLAEKGYFIRQKLYATVQKGQLHQKSAGYSDLRLSEEDFKSLLNGRKVSLTDEVLPSLRGVLKSKELYLLERSRQIKGDQSDSRIPDGLDTVPIRLPLK